ITVESSNPQWQRDSHQRASTKSGAVQHTSGFVEGLNNKLKLLKRRCFGLDNPVELFRRLWLDLEGPRLWV
ncbi:MAG: transposase, partial [Candidatus Competibacteraceae bacterium]|nr:transposase [Candidatus Competibacteraceae bacterium]